MFEVLFSGTTELTLDTKGRFSMPAKYKNAFIIQEDDETVHQCIVTRSLFDKCLWIYPKAQWDLVVEQLGQLPTLTDPLCRTIQRILLGSAVFVSLDSHGRVLLPNELRSLALLNKKAFLIGLNNKFELWSETEFKLQQQKDDELLLQNLNSLSEHSLLSNLKL